MASPKPLKAGVSASAANNRRNHQEETESVSIGTFLLCLYGFYLFADLTSVGFYFVDILTSELHFFLYILHAVIILSS